MHPADQFIAFHDLVVNGLGVDDVAARFGVSSLFVRQSLLTEKHVSASDRRACFVGVDAYVAAGGTLERDLFDEQHEGYLADPALLDRLVAERCASLVADLRAQGRHGSSRILGMIIGSALQKYNRLQPAPIDLDPAVLAEVDKLRPSSIPPIKP
jgi:ParB family chromosome partitioning protein